MTGRPADDTAPHQHAATIDDAAALLATAEEFGLGAVELDTPMLRALLDEREQRQLAVEAACDRAAEWQQKATALLDGYNAAVERAETAERERDEARDEARRMRTELASAQRFIDEMRGWIRPLTRYRLVPFPADDRLDLRCNDCDTAGDPHGVTAQWFAAPFHVAGIVDAAHGHEVWHHPESQDQRLLPGGQTQGDPAPYPDESGGRAETGLAEHTSGPPSEQQERETVSAEAQVNGPAEDALGPLLARLQQHAETAERERDQARAKLAKVVTNLADVVASGRVEGEDADGFIRWYLLPTGPLHRAIPLLQEHGLTIRPGFDGRTWKPGPHQVPQDGPQRHAGAPEVVSAGQAAPDAPEAVTGPPAAVPNPRGTGGARMPQDGPQRAADGLAAPVATPRPERGPVEAPAAPAWLRLADPSGFTDPVAAALPGNALGSLGGPIPREYLSGPDAGSAGPDPTTPATTPEGAN